MKFINNSIFKITISIFLSAILTIIIIYRINTNRIDYGNATYQEILIFKEKYNDFTQGLETMNTFYGKNLSKMKLKHREDLNSIKDLKMKVQRIKKSFETGDVESKKAIVIMERVNDKFFQILDKHLILDDKDR
jgi:hypothetical protein